MLRSSQKQRSATRCVALGLVLAGTLVGSAPADAASTHRIQAADGSTLRYPNPQYPNHKPLRGNYPGSYTSSATTPAERPSSGFDWLAAGTGAAGMLGLILLLIAGRAVARNARNRGRDVPLVLEIRDDAPA